jgi:hypothetical protein
MLQDIATMRAQLKAVPETAKKTVEEAHGLPNEFKRVAEAAIHQKEHEEVTLAEYMALTARDGKKVRKGFAAWLNQNAKARVGQMTAQQIKPDHWRRAELKAASGSCGCGVPERCDQGCSGKAPADDGVCHEQGVSGGAGAR